MTVFADPFFWALVSLSGMVVAQAVVGSARLARIRWLGLLGVGLFAFGRVVLVLPAVPQVRFAAAWSPAAGSLVLAAGVFFMIPAFSIRPFTGPAAGVRLKDTGYYGFVRNPLYLAELLWCLGLAILFRSWIGIALVPLWWVALWLVTIVEEERLERELGPAYREYRQRVRGRIVPGLPI